MLIWSSGYASAQVAASDSLFITKATSNTALVYQDMIGEQSRLNNGIQYAGYPFPFVKGHPFFEADSLQNGSVVYDHVLYRHVQLMFDELSDLVLVSLAGHRIQLSNERITNFTIGQKEFILLVKDPAKTASIDKDGFYQVLYSGGIAVYKHEVKTILEELSSSEGTLRSILVKKNFFIRKGNDFFPVDSKKAVLNIFGDRKKEIREYLKENDLNFKNDPETMLVKASTYYDQLSK